MIPGEYRVVAVVERSDFDGLAESFSGPALGNWSSGALRYRFRNKFRSCNLRGVLVARNRRDSKRYSRARQG